jgi:hypothetical protein
MTELQQKRASRKVKKASARYYRELIRTKPARPTFFRLMAFRMSRTSLRLILDESFRDYSYYKDKGWFESDYYDDVPLGVIKKLAGCLLDFLAKRMAGNS